MLHGVKKHERLRCQAALNSSTIRQPRQPRRRGFVRSMAAYWCNDDRLAVLFGNSIVNMDVDGKVFEVLTMGEGRFGSMLRLDGDGEVYVFIVGDDDLYIVSPTHAVK